MHLKIIHLHTNLLAHTAAHHKFALACDLLSPLREDLQFCIPPEAIRNMKLNKLVAAAAMLLGMSSTAQAQLVATGLDCDHNGVLAYMGASACSGAWRGNVNNQLPDINAKISSLWGGNYTLLGYSNETNNGPFQNGPSANNGTLTFDGYITGEFIVALKAGNAFSLYRFTGQTNAHTINFKTDGVQVNGNDIAAGLSHAALFADPSTSITTTSVVPEPSTYALMGAGLFAVGFAARRRRKA